MGRINLIYCDECGREAEEAMVVDWIEMNPVGPVISLPDVPRHDGVYCGVRCVAAKMNRTLELQEHAYGRESAL